MRLVVLYLRSRQIGRDLALLATPGAAVWAGRTATAEIRPDILPLVVVLPLLAATVIGNSSCGPFGALEMAASRPLAPLRALHPLLLVAFAVLIFSAAGGAPSEEVMRNTAGLTGIALLTTCLTGAPFAWLAPLGYCLYVLSSDPSTQSTWPAHPAGDHTSAFIAGVVFSIGVAAVSARKQDRGSFFSHRA